MRKCMCIGFPVLAIERYAFDRSWLRAEAAEVHVNAIWIRAWNVIGFDAAYPTEIMPSDARVEPICGDKFGARKQPELRFRHD